MNALLISSLRIGDYFWRQRHLLQPAEARPTCMRLRCERITLPSFRMNRLNRLCYLRRYLLSITAAPRKRSVGAESASHRTSIGPALALHAPACISFLRQCLAPPPLLARVHHGCSLVFLCLLSISAARQWRRRWHRRWRRCAIVAAWALCRRRWRRCTAGAGSASPQVLDAASVQSRPGGEWRHPRRSHQDPPASCMYRLCFKAAGLDLQNPS